MNDTVGVISWDGQQLTYLQEERHSVRTLMLELLCRLRDEYACQGWKHIAEPELIVDDVLDSVTLMRTATGYVGFTLGTPWFMSAPIISEEFVVMGTNLTDAVEGLKEIGRRHGAVRVTFGTRAAHNGRHQGLARVYERLGCTVSTIELTTEIT